MVITYICARFRRIKSLKNRNATIIDSADTGKDEWFGDDDKFNSSIWVGNNMLMYYKHTDAVNFGEIVCINFKSKNKHVVLRSVPERDFSWFGYYDGYFYFSRRNILFRIKDGKEKETIFFEKNRLINILSAEVLPY